MARSPEAAESRAAVEEKILAVARHSFNARGYVATTMRQIAKEVGMEAQSLYNYYPSKQQMFATLSERGTTVLRDRVEAALADASDDPQERLATAIKAHVMHYCDFEQVILVREVLPHIDGDLRDVIVRSFKAYEDIFKQILVAGIQSGAFDDLDVSPTAFALLGMGESVVNWYRPGRRLTVEQIGDLYAELALNMVRPASHST